MHRLKEWTGPGGRRGLEVGGALWGGFCTARKRRTRGLEVLRADRDLPHLAGFRFRMAVGRHKDAKLGNSLRLGGECGAAMVACAQCRSPP